MLKALNKVKLKEQECLQAIAEQHFSPLLPTGFRTRPLNEADLSNILSLQAILSKNGSLKQNTEEMILKSMENGVWIGIFNDDILVAYTALEFEMEGDACLIYFKVTAKNTPLLKGIQEASFRLRIDVGKHIVNASHYLYVGGYCTVQNGNLYSERNIVNAELTRILHVKALYSSSPGGDRDIYACGDLQFLADTLKKRWVSKIISES